MTQFKFHKMLITRTDSNRVVGSSHARTGLSNVYQQNLLKGFQSCKFFKLGNVQTTLDSPVDVHKAEIPTENKNTYITKKHTDVVMSSNIYLTFLVVLVGYSFVMFKNTLMFDESSGFAKTCFMDSGQYFLNVKSSSCCAYLRRYT